MLTVDSRGRNPRGHIEVRLVDAADLNGELPLGAVAARTPLGPAGAERNQ